MAHRTSRERGRASLLIALAILAVASVSAVPRKARAEGPAVRKGARLAWARGVGAERCVGAIGLEEDVRARLGYSPFDLPSELSLEGTIVRAQPIGFRAELVIRDPDGKILGTRQLASREADCRSLGEAVAVAITVAIDPDAPGTRATLVEASVAPVEAPPASAPIAPLAVPPEPRGRAILAAGASAGLVPNVTPVMVLRAMMNVASAWELGLGVHVIPESRIEGFGFGLTSLSLDACVAPFAAARALRWCAAAHVGLFQVFVHAPELSPLEVGMFPWAAAETGPALLFPLFGALRLEVRAAAIVPIARRQAFVRGAPTPVWEQSVVGGSAAVGLGAGF